MNEIPDAIKSLRESSNRKFSQTFDLIINISNIDLKKPESKFSKDIVLPHGKGKINKVCILAESSEYNKLFLTDIEKDKKAAKAFCKSYDFFLCETSLMVLVGKVLGRYLGPSGKMPRPLPPNVDPKTFSKVFEKSIRLRIKDSPVIQCVVGNQTMDDIQIKENIDKVVEEVRKSMPPKSAIKNAYLKLTMSKPVLLNIVR
ncbi:MAG: 50S ribosomal protein L1 [Candidatus Aenigmatarchaeota archaeon]